MYFQNVKFSMFYYGRRGGGGYRHVKGERRREERGG